MLDLTPQPHWGHPFTQEDWDDCVSRLGCTDRDLRTLINVEMRQNRMFGYLQDKRVAGLYERQWFHRLTEGRFAGIASPRISNPNAVKAYGSLDVQWELLLKAMTYDEDAALQSYSWGIGQVMGFHWKLCGYTSVQSFARDMCEYEGKQLRAMTAYIANKAGLADALRSHDWRQVAYLYNGEDYAKNKYHLKLPAEYDVLEHAMPDLQVRTMQAYLRYLGEDVMVDGQFGPQTQAALERFRQKYYAHGPQPLTIQVHETDVARGWYQVYGIHSTPEAPPAIPLASPTPLVKLALAIEVKMQEYFATLAKDMAQLRGGMQDKG